MNWKFTDSKKNTLVRLNSDAVPSENIPTNIAHPTNDFIDENHVVEHCAYCYSYSKMSLQFNCLHLCSASKEDSPGSIEKVANVPKKHKSIRKCILPLYSKTEADKNVTLFKYPGNKQKLDLWKTLLEHWALQNNPKFTSM